jgi:hypothetical protein
MRNSVDKYWNVAETSPLGIAVQVRVTDGCGDFYLLPYPCRLTAAGWVNARTGTALMVTPTHWQPHVETLPSKRTWARRFNKSGMRVIETERSKPPLSPMPVPLVAEAKLNEP